MTPTAATPRTQPGPGRLRRRARFALAACACAALVACGGGGGGSAGVGTGGTGSFAVGSINGLGSIYVNGVRFDTRAATVTNPNAPAGAAVPTAANLQLGMTVEVRGEIRPGGTSTAATVVIASEFKGAIDSVGADTLVIFGRTVQVTPATIFAGRIGTTLVTTLTQLQPGNVVEIYGLPQPDGSLRATRIEFEADSVGGFIAEYGVNARFHVEGVLTNLSGAASTRSFSVAGVQFNEGAITAVTGTLDNNAEVTVSFAPTAVDPPFVATSVRVESRAFPSGVVQAEIEGVVSGWDANQQTFTVQGFPVRLEAGVLFEFDGPVRPVLRNDVRIEVYGNVVTENGVRTLVATKVEFEDEDNDLDAFEFAGVATCPSSACSGTAGSFTLTLSGGRTVTIDYGADTEFERGITPANLQNLRVEVDAEVILSGAGSGERFFATWIGPAD